MRKDEKHANAFSFGFVFLHTFMKENAMVEVTDLVIAFALACQTGQGNINLSSPFFPAQITRQISIMEWKIIG